MREFSLFSAWASTMDAQHVGVLYLVMTWEEIENIASLGRRALASGRRDGDFRRVVGVRAGTLFRFDGSQHGTSKLACRATRDGLLRLTGTCSGNPFVAGLGYSETLVRGWSEGRTGVLADYLNGRLAYPLTKK